MILDIFSFSEFLAIIQYAFEKILIATSSAITTLMSDNLVKYFVFVGMAYFIVYVFLRVLDFVEVDLLKRKLENKDSEKNGKSKKVKSISTKSEG